MWRHVHDIFEQEGANEYVIWVWAPNRIDKLPAPTCARPQYLQRCYPGDEYVDWVGHVGIPPPAVHDRRVDHLRRDLRGDPRASCAQVADKPIMLAEVGRVRDRGAQARVGDAASSRASAGRRTTTSSGSPGSASPSPPTCRGSAPPTTGASTPAPIRSPRSGTASRRSAPASTSNPSADGRRQQEGEQHVRNEGRCGSRRRRAPASTSSAPATSVPPTRPRWPSSAST